MAKLGAFLFTSLNGYIAGPGGDISWHRHGAEENEYAATSLSHGSALLFGRVTYELMAAYWPTAQAAAADPVVAEGMNCAEKIVFSRTLTKAHWANTRIISDNITEEVRRLKLKHDRDMTILGSGSIVSLFLQRGLIDELQIMVDPVGLPAGTPLFNELKQAINLKLVASRSFPSGTVLLSYQPLE